MPDLTYWTELLLDWALSPALWLGVVAALACTVPFIIVRGGGPGQVVRDVVVGLTGFAAGQLFGILMGTDPLRVGQVHLMWGVLGSVTALFLGRLVWHRPSVG